MPNKYVHRPVGAGAGYAASFYCSKGLPARERNIEAISAAVGGYLGAAAPDWIDPPTSPNHRSAGHSIFIAGGGLTYAAIELNAWRSSLKAQADAAFKCGKIGQGYLFLIAAGAVTGFVAGYLSHLALDATTPRGLPLVK